MIVRLALATGTAPADWIHQPRAVIDIALDELGRQHKQQRKQRKKAKRKYRQANQEAGT